MIHKIEKMCEEKDFDKSEVEKLLQCVDINQEFFSIKFTWEKGTLLKRAIECANYEMVELLLKNGANPNLVYGERHFQENVLWDLQYSSEDVEEDKLRLKIVKLLLDYGANPHIKVEDDDLLCWALSNWGEDEGIQSDYRGKFINLLEEYDA